MSPVSLAGQCLLSDAVSHLIASLSMLSTLLIAVDQYLAILHALRYHHHMTRLRSSLSLGTVWVLSCVITITTLCIHHRDIAILWSSCEQADFSPLLSHSGPLHILLSCTITAITFLAPILLMLHIYSRIYLEAHNSSERSRKCNLKPSDFMHNMSATVPLQCINDGDTQWTRSSHSMKSPTLPPSRMRRSSTTSCVDRQDRRCQRKTSLPTNSLSFKENLGHFRHRISNAGQFIHREEGKTAKVYIISLAAVIICWFPLAISRTTNIFVTLRFPCWASFSTLFLALSYAVVSPFIFAYRNKKVRREVLNLLNIKSNENCLPSVSILSVPSIYEGQSVKDLRRKRKESMQLRHSFLLELSGRSLVEGNIHKTIRFVETNKNFTECEASDKDTIGRKNQLLSVSTISETSERSSFSSASTAVSRMSSKDERNCPSIH